MLLPAASLVRAAPSSPSLRWTDDSEALSCISRVNREKGH
eukprot:COSAG03_NODE_26873_length_256_cov_0.993631_1_plen_39_part_10